MTEEYKAEVIERREKDPLNPNPLATYEEFWTDKELHELRAVNNMMNLTAVWIEDHKYEIENHFSIFEWLRIYGDAVLDQNLDMN